MGQKRTVRKGRSEKDGQNKTAENDSQKRTTRTGEPGQESLNMRDRTRWIEKYELEHENHDGQES